MAEADYTFSFSVGDAVSFPKPLSQEVPPHGIGSWDPVDRWLRGKRPKTQQLYSQHMKRFLGNAGLASAAEFLSWTRTHLDPIGVEETIQHYLATLPRASRGVGASALKTFVESNGSTRLSKDFVSNEVRDGRADRQFRRGFEKEEVRDILRYLDDDTEQLLVYFQKDTGFRAETTLALRYHNVKDDLEAGKDYCHVRLWPRAYTGRKRAGITFIGPNTVTLLRALVKKGIVRANPDRCDVNADPSDEKAACTCSRIFPKDYETYREALRRAMVKAGIESDLPKTAGVRRSWKMQPTHGLRKFYTQSLQRVQPAIDDDKKRQLEGHSLGVLWHYTDQSPKSLLPFYQQAYQYLDLTEETSEQRELKELREKLARIPDVERELVYLRSRMSRLESVGSITTRDPENRPNMFATGRGATQ